MRKAAIVLVTVAELACRHAAMIDFNMGPAGHLNNL
jgi:hypothetical protein